MMLSLASPTRRRLLWLSLFTLAMAQLEAAVVVYLRNIYYPDGFEFPLAIIHDRIAAIEIGREAATVIMFFGLAKLYSAHDRWRQYAAFLWAFGLWDILYYFWLWIMLRWPSSLLDFDVLFLIPLPWIGPVLAPVLISLVMMAASWAILSLRDRGHPVLVTKPEWAITVGGAVALIVLFMSDATAVVAGDMPRPFNWLLFGLLLLLPLIVAWRAYARSGHKPLPTSGTAA
jgi:hypothetical protein